ncbi:hypothetical protein GWI33_015731 [Rhynchophorus ferrugineus]|uniref:Uncharacterized protein n=1 Tax=Rhynchophorus ferrugineus TaxID=354439 RepID=A0A834M464_RHYFE|nr:hypothetical protein GWI33_015731 [Rhynchophorus ferrugineus]
MYRSAFFVVLLMTDAHAAVVPRDNVGVHSSSTPPGKLFFPVETYHRFPPVIEYFVQKIQSAHSSYVHEDLSRPPTYDRPVYTLSPADQVFFGLAENTTPSTTTERLFEIIGSSEETQDSLTITNGSLDTDYEETMPMSDNLFQIIKKGHKVTTIPNLIEKGDESVANEGHTAQNVVYIKSSVLHNETD